MRIVSRLAVCFAAIVLVAAGAAEAATIALNGITNNSTCVTANGDDGNDNEQAYNPANGACSEPAGGSDSNFFRVSNTGTTSASASAGNSTSLGFNIDAAVGVDSAVDGQDEYERGKVRYSLSFLVTATAIENWAVDLSQSLLGLYGFAGDGAATGVGTQVFGNAGITVINVDVGTTDVSFNPSPVTASSNVANTGNQSFGPFTGGRNDVGVVSGTGNGSFTVTVSFDIDAFSNAGCTGFICSSASGGEDAAVLLGYDNVDDCCGGTVDRINADNYSMWGRAVAPDGYNSTFTFRVSTNCGNGVVQGTEQCDQGGANGTATSCCTSSCTFRGNGSTCRGVAGSCDIAETCSGSSGVCPADIFQPVGIVCRTASAGDFCDVPESCTGTAAACPADGVQPAGTTCRIGSGDACDVAESCDGSSKSCPANIVAPSGTACRVGSGDTCDVNETCTGTPGQTCPANDAPGKAGTVCRTGSGDTCDVNETCTGTPGQTCPANDAPGKAGTVCRTGSGDVCDVNETCTGTPGQTCPANDAPGKAGTVCNPGSGDLCDPAETCTGTPGQTCPNDSFASAGTACRAAAGVCDVAETCSGVADQTCPTNGFVPDGTGCSDGAYCNGAETCQAGTCSDSDNPCLGDCDEGMNICLASCPTTPASGCRTAGKSQLLLKDKSPDGKDKLLWKWLNGQNTVITDFGQPQTITDYALCVYTGGGGVLTSAVVPADPQAWRLLAGKGFSYLSSTGANDGIQRILLKGSSTNKSKVFWKGKGALLPDLVPGTLPLTSADFPVRVQMLNTANSICFESTFNETDAKRNRADQLKLKR